MPSGVYKRTPEMNAANSKSKMGHSVSPKTRMAISEGNRNSDAVKAKNKRQRGVPLSPEHCAALSAARRNSDAVKDAAKRQRGGHDIVEHHYIYDHNDLSKYTTEMTRSQHSRLHLLMRRAGIKVPHINVKKINNQKVYKV